VPFPMQWAIAARLNHPWFTSSNGLMSLPGSTPAHDADQRVIQTREKARMEAAPVLIERREGYRVVTLNRPRHLNAFTEAMHQHLKRALAEAEDDGDCRALLLTGAGRAFCAGQDLHERVDKDGKAIVLGSALDTYYNPLVRRLRALPFPVVAAVNGIAAGAGANIALGCDIVLAARSASFVQAFAKIGLIPDCGGTWLLPRLIGPARAPRDIAALVIAGCFRRRWMRGHKRVHARLRRAFARA